MARKLTAAMTFDTFEDEVLHTRTALAADPDAQDLVAMTEGWLGKVDAARALDRTARVATAEATALRQVSNGRLDPLCAAFGDALYLAVGKDRGAARWTQFFKLPVNRFVRQAFPTQVTLVRGWLAIDDSLLATHRTGLDTWSAKGQEALARTAATVAPVGAARLAREQLAEDLTRERDGLEDALSSRARERKLPRDWPSLFFRTTPSRQRTDEAADTLDDPPSL